MSENFNLWLDIDEKIKNPETLKREIIEIGEIEKIEDVKNHGVVLCLLIILIAPLIVEIIIRRTPSAIERFRKILRRILRKAKKSSDKAELTIEYKNLVLNIKEEEEIEEKIEDLINYAYV